MPLVLVVHHTPSPVCHQLLDAVLTGAREAAEDLGSDGSAIEVVARPALIASAAEALAADAIVLGTPVNIGTVSGALKHFLDQAYYPCLTADRKVPYGLWVHGNDSTAGAVRAVERIVTGIGWARLREPVEVVGAATPSDLRACADLGGLAVAAAAGLT